MTNEPPPVPTTTTSSLTRFLDGVNVGLIIAIFITIPLALGLIWATTLPTRLSQTQRFVPTASGTTLHYRVTLPDGTIRYQSSNIGQLRGTDGFNLIELNAKAEIMARYVGVPFTEITEDQITSFLTNDIGQIRVARLLETTYTSTETVSTSESLFLIENHQIVLVSVDEQAFILSIPFYDDTLTVGDSINTKGTFGFDSPYSSTLTLEAVEAVETPIQPFEGCQRFVLTVEITEFSYTRLRSWFCEGVGVVKQESATERTGEITQFELIAALTPALKASTEFPPLLAPDTVPFPISAPALFQADQWETVWSFRNEGVNADIATEIIPFGALYIYGDEGGNLMAVNRESHTLAWRFQTGDSLFTKPIIVNGMVYSVGANRTLYALDAQNGSFRWAFTARDLLSASPAIVGETVYVGAEDGTLYALDAQTGSEKWEYKAAGPIAATPVVHEGVIYVGSDDGALYALESASGEPRWIFPSDAGIVAGVAIADDLLFVGNVDRWVYALNLNTTRPQGEVIWAFEAEDAVEEALKVMDGNVFVTVPNFIHVLDSTTGAEVWRYRTDLTIRGTPLHLQDSLLVNTSRALIVLNPTSGAVMGTIPTGSPESYTPIATDGTNLLVGHADGYLRVMSNAPTHPWQGKEQWVTTTLTNRLFDLEDELGTPPVADGEDLLYVTAYGRVFRVNRATGEATLLGETDLELAYLPPRLANDTLITGTYFGELTAFNLTTNRVQWRVDLNTSTFTSAFVADNLVLWAGTVGDEVIAYGFDMTTGETVWQQSLPYALGAAPSALLYEGVFYVVGDTLTALNPATGEILWQPNAPIRPLYLTASHETIYAMGITEDFATLVVGWDVNSRKVTTLIPYDASFLPSLYGGMASDNGMIALASEEGEITLLDGAARKPRWQVANTEGILGSPLFVDDTLLYITKNNHLHARRLEDGALVGDFALQSVAFYQTQGSMTPVLVNDTLYAGFFRSAFALPLRK